ncbi:MAG: flagellar biosynthesis anti-sigma factor FlgM [Firmicutes bacterium]|nr:flagellar biosynthesis anti-sigma factor FlgM [Bacillota bacterium]
MKINNLGTKISKLYQQSEAKETAKKAETQKKQDSLTISSQAAKLPEIVKMVDKLSDVRSERVERLQAEIAQGTYRPDSKKIAQAMLKKQE